MDDNGRNHGLRIGHVYVLGGRRRQGRTWQGCRVGPRHALHGGGGGVHGGRRALLLQQLLLLLLQQGLLLLLLLQLLRGELSLKRCAAVRWEREVFQTYGMRMGCKEAHMPCVDNKHGMYVPGRLGRSWVDSPDEEPVVHVAQGIRHERRGLIVPPLAVDYEFVLVIPER